MALFKKKEEAPASISPADEKAQALFQEYTALKGQEYEVKARMKEVIESLKTLADRTKAWKGKTARFGQYVLQKKETKALVLPDCLDLEDTRLQDYLVTELDKKAALNALMAGDEDLKALGFEVEVKESYTPRAF